jgi:sigma-E factor negative regulatory protein RseC
MATEIGIVTKISDPGMALVSTVRSGACESCTAKGMCHNLGGGNEAEVMAINSANARVGDRIVISFQTSSLMKAMFLLYIFPILWLLAGAVIGHNYSSFLGMNSSALSAIVGFLFFFIAVIFVKTRANQLAKKDTYQPRIIRVLERGDKV